MGSVCGRLRPGLVLFAPLIAACSIGVPPGEEAGERLVAQGVKVEIPAAGAGIVVAGDRLTSGAGVGQFEISGDASVSIDGESPARVRAERITVDVEGPVVLMEGRVRARFDLPQEVVGDGGL